MFDKLEGGPANLAERKPVKKVKDKRSTAGKSNKKIKKRAIQEQDLNNWVMKSAQLALRKYFPPEVLVEVYHPGAKATRLDTVKSIYFRITAKSDYKIFLSSKLLKKFRKVFQAKDVQFFPVIENDSSPGHGAFTCVGWTLHIHLPDMNKALGSWLSLPEITKPSSGV
jgi:hypothetical protein